MFEEMVEKSKEIMQQAQRTPTATFQIKKSVQGRDILCQANNLELVLEGFKRLEKEVERWKEKSSSSR